MARITFRPLSDRSWLRHPSARTGTRFRAKYEDTIALLEAELAAVDGTDLIIGVDVTEVDLTLDGRVRARSTFRSPAVEVAFDSRHGPLLYRCDAFDTTYHHQGPGWRHNLRAVALTLAALRAVDRYGATSSGEQYRGFRAIADTPAVLSRSDAIAVVVEVAGAAMGPEVEDGLPGLWRLARRNAHPDRNGGQRAAWDNLERAGRVLGLLD